MHINHLHHEFDQSFSQNLVDVQKLFDSHPILRKKNELLNSLHHDHVIDLKQQIHALGSLIIHDEKPLWEQMELRMPHLIHTQIEQELHSDEKKFVHTHSLTVREHFGPAFLALEEYALISDTKHYPQSHQDYQKFQQAVDAITQKEQMQQLLEKQCFLIQKLDYRLKTDASTIYPQVQTLKSSLLDQQALLSRIPHFRID